MPALSSLPTDSESGHFLSWWVTNNQGLFKAFGVMFVREKNLLIGAVYRHSSVPYQTEEKAGNSFMSSRHSLHTHQAILETLLKGRVS
jgi:hypothetical protein